MNNESPSKGKYAPRKQFNSGSNGNHKGLIPRSSLSDTTNGLILFILALYVIGLVQSYLALPHLSLSRYDVMFPGWSSSSGTIVDTDLLSQVSSPKVPSSRMTTSRGDDVKWPTSVLQGVDYETIIHPADAKSSISVPKFYADHVTDGRLMTREEADGVGILVPVMLENGEVQMMPTIFVAIASYRDWQCRYTVESVYQRAKYPERIRIGVVDQIEHGTDDACDIPIKPCSEDPEQALCKYRDRIDVFEMEAELSVGPVFARHVGHRMYRGEYYSLQCDAHVTFTTNWDEDIISQIKDTGNEMAVLSTYLSDIQGSIDEKTGNSLRHTRPIMCNTDYERDTVGQHLRHMSQPEGNPIIKGTPQLEPYWAAGFSFSRGHFVLNVPYDQYQPMVFQGEEISITVRGFTWGYDFYAPERSVCFHMYAEGVNKAKRKKVALFWENDKLYRGKGREGMTRLLGIIGMNKVGTDESKWNHTDEAKYGLGTVRSNQKYFETFGIHTENQTVEHHLCQFVANGNMHNIFTKFLREDGMGIDYDKVSYSFKDPRPNDKNW